MRLFLTSFVIALLVGTCTKRNDITKIKHQRNIQTGKLLEFDLGGLPTEGSILINKQAEHFQVSEIEFNLYKYQSSQDFIGKDLVVIERREGSGVGPLDLITLIELEIIVSD